MDRINLPFKIFNIKYRIIRSVINLDNIVNINNKIIFSIQWKLAYPKYKIIGINKVIVVIKNLKQ